ncbi:MAG: YfhO family protein [Verrucomicrobiae bacterium]|nr:YfhO family protein [Verrucomicrobiae bacterium]
MIKNPRLLFAVVLILAALWFYLPTLRPGHLILGDDTISGYYFVAKNFRDSGARWTPEILAGFDALTFFPTHYPASVLFKIAPPETALALTIVLHFFLAAIGMYLLVRRLGLSEPAAAAGAILFTCNALFVSHAGQFLLLVPLSFFPWLFWSAEKLLEKASLKNLAVFAFVLAMMFVQPHFQLVLYAGLLLAMYLPFRFKALGINSPVKFRNAAMPFILCLAVAVLAASAHLYSAMIMKGATSRGGGMDYNFAASGSYPPEEVFSLFLPAVFGDWTNHAAFFPKINTLSPFYWGRMDLRLNPEFIGIGALLLMSVALLLRWKDPLIKFWSLTGLFFLSLSFGKYFLTFPLIYQLVPGLEFLRGPYRFLYVVLFIISLLGAYGLEALLKATPEERIRLTRLLALVTTSLLFLGFVFVLFVNLTSPFQPFKIYTPDLIRQHNLQPAVAQGYASLNFYWAMASLYAAFFGTVWILIIRFFPKNLSGWLPALLPALLLIELLPVSKQYVTTIPVENVYFQKDKIVNYLLAQKSSGQPFRILSEAGFAQWLPNKGLLYGIENAIGYQATINNQYVDMMELMRKNPRILDLLNVRYFVAPTGLRIMNLQAVEQDSSKALTLYENPNVIPRVQFLTEAVKLPLAADRLRFMGGNQFNPRRTVVLSDPDAPLPSGKYPPSVPAIQKIEYGPDRLTVVCQSNADGYLAVSDNNFPGWHVSVNGVPQPVRTVNHAFRGVYLQPGIHTVVFTYENPPLTALTWLGRLIMVLLALTILAPLLSKSTARPRA